MSTTYSVTLANTNDGTVHGHAAGCADLKRGAAYKHHKDEQFTVEVETKRDAFLDYNADFIAEGGEENAWPVEWLPCADHVPADAAASATPKKATKADQIAVLLERGTYTRTALQKMTLAALTALVEEAPATPPSQPATEQKAKRGKNATVEVGEYTVKTGATCVVHDKDGARVAVLRRDAIESLASVEVAKEMRVMTEYALADGQTSVSVGWVRNGVKPVAIGKVIAKALKAAAK